MQSLRRALPVAAPASSTRGSRSRAAGNRARNAVAGRNWTDPAPLPRRQSRRRGRGVRRLASRARHARGRHRRSSLGTRRAGAHLDLPRRRRRRALGPVAAGRSALHEAPAAAGARRRDPARRGRSPLLASRARRPPAALRGEEGDRHAGGRLHPRRPVALHVAPLLGGRSDGGQPPNGLARALPRPDGEEGQPSPGAVAGLCARTRACDCQGAGRLDLRPRPVRLLQQASLGPGRAADARDHRPDGGSAR